MGQDLDSSQPGDSSFLCGSDRGGRQVLVYIQGPPQLHSHVWNLDRDGWVQLVLECLQVPSPAW